jgi:hypothetical protein
MNLLIYDIFFFTVPSSCLHENGKYEDPVDGGEDCVEGGADTPACRTRFIDHSHACTPNKYNIDF